MPDSGTASLGVVCVTGGAKTAHEVYSEWQEYFAGRGIASVSFDARGRGESGGVWSTDDSEFDHRLHYNSQASRVQDTLSVIEAYRQVVGQEVGAYALLGTSMGGDVAVHAAHELRKQDVVQALLLKAPAAYHPAAHHMLYGKRLRTILRGNQDYPAFLSDNFRKLREVNVPTQLIFARGDEVIPQDIQELYRLVTEEIELSEVVFVGDESTRHGYFTQEGEEARRAKEMTFERSVAFLRQVVTTMV